MNIPRSLNVFGIKIRLKLDKKIPNNVAGYFHIDKNLITLNPAQSDKEMLHTIIHEIGHALFYRVSINQAVSFETHEYIVNNIATMMTENFDIKFKKTTKAKS